MPDAIDRLERRVQSLEDRLQHTEQTVNQIKSDTTELIALFKAGKVGAVIFRWIVYVVATTVGIWVAIKGMK